MAYLATKEEQIAVAERVLATQGKGAWPSCGGPLSAATPRNIVNEEPQALVAPAGELPPPPPLDPFAPPPPPAPFDALAAPLPPVPAPIDPLAAPMPMPAPAAPDALPPAPAPIDPLAAPMPMPAPAAPDALPPAPAPMDAPLPPAPVDAPLPPAPVVPLAAPLPEALPQGQGPLMADAPMPVLPEPAGVTALDAPMPAPAEAPPVEAAVTVANWDVAPTPAGQPAMWSLPIDVALQPAPALPPAPPAPAPVDPMAPLAGVDIPAPAYDIANQAVSGELPIPAETPHLVSPENLPPGTTVNPDLVPNESANVTYLKEIWHAIQTQEISGSDALLALTQRPMSTPDPYGAPPAAPVPAPGDPGALAPLPIDPAAAPGPAVPAPAPVMPPA